MSRDRRPADDVSADTMAGRSRRALLAGAAAAAAGALAANSLADPPEAQASSDNQFTALGPAVIGFQTDSTNIDVGVQVAGNSVGVNASGPTGVIGVGSDREGGSFVGPVGVSATGTTSVGAHSAQGRSRHRFISLRKRAGPEARS